MIDLYHKLSIEETISALDVNPEDGLSYQEAASRVSKSIGKGENSSFFKFAAAGFSRPYVWLLIIAAALTALFDGLLSASLILAVIVINAVFSAECKRRGLKKIASSVRPSVTHAIVLRNGAKMRIPSDELAVGDIVSLKPGRIVPADLRLIMTDSLVIDETALTGLSGVEKDASATLSGDAPVERRVNCAFEGTVVLRGRGDGVVVASGLSTEMSRLSIPTDTPARDSAPVLSRVKKLCDKITLIISFVCVVIFIIGLLYSEPFIRSLASCIALAVAAIPEGIYTSALTALAKGASRITKNGFSLRSIDAVESLGETSAYITDIPKLGVAATYTNGRIKAPHEEDSVPFIDGLLLCELDNPSLSSFASHLCTPEEVRASFPKIGELSGEVYTTLHRAGKTTLSYTGGDSIEILNRSDRIWEFGNIRSLTESDREEIRACIQSFEDSGYSTTAIGMRSGDEFPRDSSLVFIGIAATSAESEKADTPDTATLCSLGAKVYLLTSSDAARARLGATSLSIPDKNILCGRDIERMSDLEICASLSDTFVFAGLSPKDKTRIVLALQSLGHTVAAIGSSLSDSALLDCADVSLCDIRTEDAVKGSCNILYDGETSADRAVLFGKITRGSISRVITYLCAANLTELLCVGLSVLFGFGYPMTPLQILVVNLITDIFPAMLLALSSRHFIRKKRRLIFILGAIFGVISAAVYPVLSLFDITRPFAEIGTCAVLIFLEFILVFPTYFSGGKSDVK